MVSLNEQVEYSTVGNPNFWKLVNDSHIRSHSECQSNFIVYEFDFSKTIK